MIRDEYRCSHCQHRFEAQRSIHQTLSPACPQCGRPASKVYHFPYTRLCWHAPLRGQEGSDRMVIRSAYNGQPAGALSDGSDTLVTNLGLHR